MHRVPFMGLQLTEGAGVALHAVEVVDADLRQIGRGVLGPVMMMRWSQRSYTHTQVSHMHTYAQVTQVVPCSRGRLQPHARHCAPHRSPTPACQTLRTAPLTRSMSSTMDTARTTMQSHCTCCTKSTVRTLELELV